MNEYLTWSRRDRHARAFATLGNERSRRIAANLGISDPTTAALCLDCHSDNVPRERRGRSFQLSDGVGCEACHGGAEHWIDSHANGAKHADNLGRGLYPSDEPEARARVCLSCHMGDQRKPLTHRLMAAGHPRTPFELDTWSQLQPAHFVVDEHYRARKTAPAPVVTWAMGQAVTLHEYASALADPKRTRDGVWPEFALYDCYSCHHSFGSESLNAANTFSLRPGLPRLEESRFLTLRAALSAIEPSQAARIESSLRQLNTALSSDSDRSEPVAAAVAVSTAETFAAISAWQPTPEALSTILSRLAAPGRDGVYRTYSAAEQVTLAAQAILASMSDATFPTETRARVKASVDAMFAATQDERRFDPAAFRKALESLPR